MKDKPQTLKDCTDFQLEEMEKLADRMGWEEITHDLRNELQTRQL